MTLNWADTLPTNWQVRKLKYIADIRLSNADKKSIEGEQAIRLCNYVDVYKNDFIVSTMSFMEATATDSQTRELVPRAGDVLITKDSEEWSDIAVPSYVPADLPGVICGYHLSHIRPYADQVFGGYLFRAFAADGIADQFKVAANGITRYGISKDDISSALFPVPPLSEQHAIAAFLDRKTAEIDAVIAKKERLIALLQEERQALISRAVTRGLDDGAAMKDSGIPWLGEVPKHWLIKRLRYLCNTTKGVAFKSDVFSTSGAPVVKASDIKYETVIPGKTFIPHECVSQFEKVRLFAGDLLMSTVGSKAEIIDSAVGQIARVPLELDGALLNQNTVRFELVASHLCTRDFLFLLLRAFSFRKYLDMHAHGTANQSSINLFDVLNFLVPLPLLDEQNRITDFVQRITHKNDSIISTAKHGITRLKEYRQALISAAVTGKIAVPQEVAT